VTLSVLLVDDDPAFRWLATQILTAIGAEVVASAADAAAAMSAANALRPVAALVDVELPDRDGVGLAYEMAALPWRPRVVLTSSDSDAGAAIKPPPARGRLPFVPKAQLPNAPLRALLADE
jgi:DNA-binding NarL/FixJ family response regulator